MGRRTNGLSDNRDVPSGTSAITSATYSYKTMLNGIYEAGAKGPFKYVTPGGGGGGVCDPALRSVTGG